MSKLNLSSALKRINETKRSEIALAVFKEGIDSDIKTFFKTAKLSNGKLLKDSKATLSFDMFAIDKSGRNIDAKKDKEKFDAFTKDQEKVSKKLKVELKLLKSVGPGGGSPEWSAKGKFKNIIKYLMTFGDGMIYDVDSVKDLAEFAKFEDNAKYK